MYIYILKQNTHSNTTRNKIIMGATMTLFVYVALYLETTFGMCSYAYVKVLKLWGHLFVVLQEMLLLLIDANSCTFRPQWWHQSHCVNSGIILVFRTKVDSLGAFTKQMPRVDVPFFKLMYKWFGSLTMATPPATATATATARARARPRMINEAQKQNQEQGQ